MSREDRTSQSISGQVEAGYDSPIQVRAGRNTGQARRGKGGQGRLELVKAALVRRGRAGQGRLGRSEKLKQVRISKAVQGRPELVKAAQIRRGKAGQDREG